jgi:hypothetical protein
VSQPQCTCIPTVGIYSPHGQKALSANTMIPDGLLDMLEDAVNAYERLAADIQSLRDQLDELARTRQ